MLNDKVSVVIKEIKLDYIKNPLNRFSSKEVENPNIGVLDLETFEDKDGLGKIFNLGFISNIDNKAISTFYLADINQYNSDQLLINCIDSMLVPKYNKFIFYIHNMARFDIIYIYKILAEYNLVNKTEHYILKTTYKDNLMLELVISLNNPLNKKNVKIFLRDSFNILTSSLSVLSVEYKAVTVKGHFPYSFVSRDRLNYVGKTPDIKYYPGLSEQEYKLNYLNENWDLKVESTKYLKNDLVCLLDVLNKFNKDLFIEENIQMTEGLTISRLALNKFLFYYMGESKLALINKPEIFNFIYKGYYGGQTEVYIPYGKNLYYYDVNSLYPFAALNDIPGHECTYIESLDESGLELKDLFGFFYARVKTNEQYLGLLPFKDKGLKFPNGEFEGVWSSEELKFAFDNGYKVTVLKGYNFNRLLNVFDKFINELYDKKLNSTGAIRAMIKSLLNNLIGRFGLAINKPVSKTLTLKELENILLTREVYSQQSITEDLFLVSYNPEISDKICTEHGLDYFKIIAKELKSNLELNHADKFSDVSLGVSAMINSYSRIYMNKIKLKILKHGGKIYYSDTDSLVVDFPLEELDPKLVGSGLGQFKLEYKDITEALFITNKTYYLQLKNGQVIVKAKGIKNKSLTPEAIKSMYLNNKDITAIKTESVKNLSKGSVVIRDKEIILRHNSYCKREKVYSVDGL